MAAFAFSIAAVVVLTKEVYSSWRKSPSSWKQIWQSVALVRLVHSSQGWLWGVTAVEAVLIVLMAVFVEMFRLFGVFVFPFCKSLGLVKEWILQLVAWFLGFPLLLLSAARGGLTSGMEG